MNLKSQMAVVGVGYMGLRHAKIYQSLSNTKLCAVVDIDLEQRLLAEKLLQVPSYDSIDSLIEFEKIDGVSICVPAKYHVQLTKPCFEKNLSVLLEKPFAASVLDAKQIMRAARDKLLLVGHVERFNPAIEMLKENLFKDVIGTMIRLNMTRNGLIPNKTCQSVGIHYDLVIHDLDLLQYLFDSKPTIVKIEQCSSHKISTVLHVNGIKVELSSEWGNHRTRLIQVIGSKGRLDVDLLAQEVKLTTPERTQNLAVNSQNALQLQLEHFVRCIQNQETPRITPSEALQAVELAAQLEPLVKS